LMNDDDYTDLFLQWANCHEDAIKLVLKCFKWRHEKRVNGKTHFVIFILCYFIA